MTQLKTRPILFSGPMVKAILEGRKSQTRRVSVQPQITGEYPMWRDAKADLWREKRHFIRDCCPYGKPGDRLWVRETFYFDYGDWAEGGSLKNVPEDERTSDNLYYRVDGTCCEQIPECACAEVGKTRWRSARFMPRWASRITLEITDVRVQRSQDISEADAQAEGVTLKPIDCRPGYEYREHFEDLWDSINGKSHPWSANEWVWAITFKRLEATP